MPKNSLVHFIVFFQLKPCELFTVKLIYVHLVKVTGICIAECSLTQICPGLHSVIHSSTSTELSSPLLLDVDFLLDHKNKANSNKDYHSITHSVTANIATCRNLLLIIHLSFSILAMHYSYYILSSLGIYLCLLLVQEVVLRKKA